MKSMRAVFSSTKYVFFDPYIYCQKNKAYKKHAASALVLHMNGIYEAGPGQLKEKTFIAVGIKKSRADGSDKIERKVFIELACTTWGKAPTPETYFIADVADIPDKNFTLQIERNPTTGAFAITMNGKNIMPNNVNADLLANLKNTQTTRFTSGTFMVELHDIRSHAPGMESGGGGESAYIVTDVMYKRDTDSLLWRKIADKEAEENNPPEVKTDVWGFDIYIWDTRNKP